MKIDTCQSVWDAIADSPEEAANLKLRSQLMDILAAYMRHEDRFYLGDVHEFFIRTPKAPQWAVYGFQSVLENAIRLCCREQGASRRSMY